ncbi:DUF6493 family protein [Actinoplanes sp. CA-142083]|uniref:DUF6493 family protein n=1 Tax=Actinoplanes sp. CA-142083 TaxID=3239903 RepID=UPI003D8C4E10
MSLGWGALRHRAEQGDVDGVREMLLEAGEEERRSFATGLKDLSPEDWWRSAGAYGLVILGTAPTAAKAATLLARRDMRDRWSQIPVPHAVAVVRARELPWVGDLGGRLAERLNPREAWSGGWEFVAALLAESGTAPPLTEGVVRGWLSGVLQYDQRPFADRLRHSPYLDLMMPALFEMDGIGAELNGYSWDHETSTPTFPAAVATLVAEGRLDRTTILDATIDRLVRGDRPAWLRPFALLHDRLAPTAGEMAGHAPDYARLLPDAPSAIAGLAQKALRAVDEAGLLELDMLLEASRPTLVRKEKALVKAQLSWLDRVARRESSPAVVEVMGAAFEHPALDIQERALTLIARRAGLLDAEALGDLGSAASQLGGDLPGRAALVFESSPPVSVSPPAPVAGPVSSAPPPESASSAPPLGPAEMPAAIGSVVELAEEVGALLHDPAAVRWERVLAGLVALRSGADLSPLQHLLDRHHDKFDQEWWPPHYALGAVVRAVVERQEPEKPRVAWHWEGLVSAVRALWSGGKQPKLGGAPDRLLQLRTAEVTTLVRQSPISTLLATPTHVNGSLDASVLVERLRRAEAEGWEPWPLDFEQALLRLPRGTSPTVADGLTSPAGQRLAAWLAGGGLPDPLSARIEQPSGKTYADPVGPPPAIGRVLVNLTPVRPGTLSVEEQILTLSRRPTVRYGAFADVRNGSALTAALPHHREVCAAWALQGLAALADQDQRGGAEILPLLAECDGPLGPAMSLAMAYVLAARHEPDRVAAIDAFLLMATSSEPFAAPVSRDPSESFAAPVGRDLGEPFAPPVGRDLGALAAGGLVKLNRAVLSLSDAHRAGASAAVWEVLGAALPALLSQAPRGLPDVLELASVVAAAVGAKEEIEGLADLAGKKGGSRMLKEARRLQSVLTS